MAATPSSEARTGLKLISPTAIYVILLLAVPLATVLIYSVMTGGRGNVSLPLTIENYTELAAIAEKSAERIVEARIGSLATLAYVPLRSPV